MICGTFAVSTGGSFTNFENVLNPGAQTFTNFDRNPPWLSCSWSAFTTACSRVVSCTPSGPSARKLYCRNRSPPASFNSNSATLRFVAPKSTAKKDFVFNILLKLARNLSPTGRKSRARNQKGIQRQSNLATPEQYSGAA